ncbi:MAG: ATP-binding protein [Fidelibacterota bacterium]|nr:MAG: ATP-binding protein [Candidatus Neomarinimicrobiota bacterium]
MASRIYQKRVVLILSMASVITIVLLLFGLLMGARIMRLEGLWRDYHREATQKYRLMSSIKSHMGYGGFIHNFKNYVLRQDEQQIARIEQNKRDLITDIGEFRRLDLTPQEKVAIAHFEDVLREYIAKFELARQLTAEGRTPSQVDTQVKVDDTPAFEALDYLISAVLEQSAAKEKETEAALSSILSFLTLGLLIIPLIFFTAIVLIVSFRLIMKGNIAVQEYAQKLETQNLALARAIDEVERATQTKSEFLAKMSHELRTPLNSVIGFTNVLLKNKDQKLGAKDLTYLDKILTNGEQLLALINDILDLSKVEAGKLELEISSVSLDRVVNDTVAQLEGQVRSTDIQLLTQLPAEITLVQTDEAKLKQVLINLVGNAIKFTERGSVTVAVHTNSTTYTPEKIDVIDTGVGIPEERLATIFEAFHQVDSSTSRKFGGTGLGLAISQSLCDLMGYQLAVTSEEGKGSTFSIILTERRVERAA